MSHCRSSVLDGESYIAYTDVLPLHAAFSCPCMGESLGGGSAAQGRSSESWLAACLPACLVHACLMPTARGWAVRRACAVDGPASTVLMCRIEAMHASTVLIL